MALKERRRRKQLLLGIVLLLTFIPSALVLIGVSVYDYTKRIKVPTVAPTPKIMALTGLNPSDILTDVLFYADKEVTIKGKVVYGEKSCTKKVCSDDDKCCGCSNNIDLVIRDTSVDLLNQSGEIRIFGPGKASFCQKKTGSCDYDCDDWEVGSIYSLTANFIVVFPPRGIGLSRGYLEYYLEVKDKKKIVSAPKNQDNIFITVWKKYFGSILSPNSL